MIISIHLMTQHEKTIEAFLKNMAKSHWHLVSRSIPTATGTCFVKLRQEQRDDYESSEGEYDA